VESGPASARPVGDSGTRASSQRSPVPYSTIRWCRGSSCRYGTSSGISNSRESDSRIDANSRLPPGDGHARTAPSPSDRSGFGIRADRFVPCSVPSPWHAGHQPSGLLNEKFCGVSSSKRLLPANCRRSLARRQAAAQPRWASARSVPSSAASVSSFSWAIVRSRMSACASDNGCGFALTGISTRVA
jgi:hypothetical protein